MKPYHLTPKRATKRALKELYISKHTPKEQAVVFRKINQIIKWILAKD